MLVVTMVVITLCLSTYEYIVFELALFHAAIIKRHHALSISKIVLELSYVFGAAGPLVNTFAVHVAINKVSKVGLSRRSPHKFATPMETAIL